MKSNAGAGGPKLIRRSAIKAKSDALAANPNLVALIQAERWNGVASRRRNGRFTGSGERIRSIEAEN